MRYYCRGALASVLLIVTHCAASAAPDYIEADSGELASAYGEAVAERAISDELTDTRTDMIKASLIPEQGCGDEPQFVLRDVYPYQVDPRDVMWIERYRVDCEKEQQRAILMLLNKDGKFQAVPMAPGTTITDPQLQIDAGNIVRTAALTRSDGSCSETRRRHGNCREARGGRQALEGELVGLRLRDHSRSRGRVHAVGGRRHEHRRGGQPQRVTVGPPGCTQATKPLECRLGQLRAEGVMAADVETVIAALRVALDEAQNSDEVNWRVLAANRWVGQLPGSWKGRWKSLMLQGDIIGNVNRHQFIGHVRAVLAFLEASRAHSPALPKWWPMRRRGNAQAAAKTEPQPASARPVNLLRIRKPMPGLH
jgi:hypothetical protein